MKIYNKLVISMITGEILEEDSFEYNGQMILARGEQKRALDKTEYEAQQEKLRADQIRDYQLQQQDQLRAQIMPKYQDLYDNPMTAGRPELDPSLREAFTGTSGGRNACG